MSVELLNKSAISKEPEYNVEDIPLGSPSQKCFKNEPSRLDESDEEQKITGFYFQDVNGKKISSITIEKEIVFVIETQNMAGEVIIIEPPFGAGFCNFQNQEVTEEHAFKVSLKGDRVEILLELII